jgi:hypothetical protein
LIVPAIPSMLIIVLRRIEFLRSTRAQNRRHSVKCTLSAQRVHRKQIGVARLDAGQRLQQWPSGCSAIVVIQHAAQAFLLLNGAGGIEVALLRTDDSIPQALMIALRLVVGNILMNRFAKRALAEENQPFQAGLLDATHEPLGMGHSGWGIRAATLPTPHRMPPADL